jgi:hypothetical protein
MERVVVPISDAETFATTTLLLLPLLLAVLSSNIKTGIEMEKRKNKSCSTITSIPKTSPVSRV